MTSSQEIPVRGRDGVIGVIDPAQQPENESDVWVRLNGGQTLRVPMDLFEPMEDGSYYLPMSREQFLLEGETGDKQTLMVIPVMKEDFHIERQEKTRALVRVHKNVKEREEVVDAAGFIERVNVERIPKNEVVDTPPQAHYEGETLVIPVLEEVLVVEKRVILKEEVRVTRLREETRQPKTIKLRSEEVNVERIEPNRSSSDELPKDLSKGDES